MRQQDKPRSAELERDEYSSLLVRVAVDRDRSAYRTLFNHFGPRVRAWLIGRMGQPAIVDDVVQDVMLTIWRKAGTFDASRATASSWIFTVARNRMVDHHRKTTTKIRYETESIKEIPPEIEPADELMMRSEDVKRVSEALQGLPDGQAQILELSYRGGFSHQEIASKLNLPLGTIKSRIRLAMQKLKLRLGEQL